MSEFNLIKCPQFLDNAITPPAKEIGTLLGNIFYAIFSPINYPVEKLRIKRSENLKKYQDDIQNEISKIPEEKLIEPKLSIVGPALEASKFYIEEDEMRKMFAKLIASSINSDINSKAHHSFVEIIKLLSSLDASNLKLLYVNSFLPIANYICINQNGSYSTLVSNVFLSNPQTNNIDRQASSIDNLNRLGLISIDYNSHLSNLERYSIFKQHPIYINFSNGINSMLDDFPGFIFSSVDIQKGSIKLTSFGKDFVSMCL